MPNVLEKVIVDKQTFTDQQTAIKEAISHLRPTLYLASIIKTESSRLIEITDNLGNMVSFNYGFTSPTWDIITGDPATNTAFVTWLNTNYVNNTKLGTANGVATLDASGHVPASQLSGQVAEVIEGYYYNGEFYEDVGHTTPLPHKDNGIYFDKADNYKQYRWTGSSFVAIANNLTVNTDRAVGTSTSAYRSDFGAANYADIQTLQTGKQPLLSATNKLNPLFIDTSENNRFVTDTQITLWTNKQSALTFDNEPTSGSVNPVKSGGLYTYIENKITGALIYKGSVATFANLPTLITTPSIASGWEYAVLDTQSLYAAVVDRSGSTPTLSWSFMGSTVSLQGYLTKIEASNTYIKITDKNVGSGVAGLDANAKLPLAIIPDFIKGGLLNGGLVSESAGVVTATISAKLQNKLGITDTSITILNSPTDDTSGTPKKYGYVTLSDVFFSVNNNFTFVGKTFNTGDSLISIGSMWDKLDHTDSVTGVKGDSETEYRQGNVNITKANIGLGDVDNTSDLNKPISTATQTALDLKQNKLPEYVDNKYLKAVMNSGSGIIELTWDSAGGSDIIDVLENGTSIVDTADKKAKIVYDDTPTENSTRAVKSGSLFTALKGKVGVGNVADAQIWAGTKSQYDAIATKDEATLYYVLDDTTEIQGVMNFKGTCLFADLPTSGQQNGDYWVLMDTTGEHAGQAAIWSKDSSSWNFAGATITVDSSLSTTSTNAIQNKVVTAALNALKKADEKTIVINTDQKIETAVGGSEESSEKTLITVLKDGAVIDTNIHEIRDGGTHDVDSFVLGQRVFGTVTYNGVTTNIDINATERTFEGLTTHKEYTFPIIFLLDTVASGSVYLGYYDGNLVLATVNTDVSLIVNNLTLNLKTTSNTISYIKHRFIPFDKKTIVLDSSNEMSVNVATETEVENYVKGNIVSITDNIAGGVLKGPEEAVKGQTATVRIVPNSGFIYPQQVAITVTGATISSYDKGKLVLSSITGDIKITATCPIDA